MSHMINKSISSTAEAVADIPDGASIAVGGFGLVGIPTALILALREQGAGDLTIISNNLGTDGFGLSDTRAALRRHFHVDAPSIALHVVERMARQQLIDPVTARAVARRYREEFGISS